MLPALRHSSHIFPSTSTMNTRKEKKKTFYDLKKKKMGTCKLILDNKRDVYYLRQPALSLMQLFWTEVNNTVCAWIIRSRGKGGPEFPTPFLKTQTNKMVLWTSPPPQKISWSAYYKISQLIDIIATAAILTFYIWFDGFSCYCYPWGHSPTANWNQDGIQIWNLFQKLYCYCTLKFINLKIKSY